MTLFLFWDFDPFNQIDGPTAPFSINYQDLLQVVGIFSSFLSFGSLDLALHVHLNQTIETYSGPLDFGCFESET
jgi:hypothetical protein